MQNLSFHDAHATALSRVALFVLALCLVGCASKNPLIDDANAPSPQSTSQPATKPAPAAEPATAPVPAAATEPAVTPAAEPAPKTEPATNQTANPGGGVKTTGTRSFLGMFSPYRVDVQQGNFISQETMAQLKEGMTREQVRFLLGTPLIADVFHAARWDYVFRLKKGSGEIISSRVTVFFDDKNTVARIEGGNLPNEADYLGLIAGSSKAAAPNARLAPTAPASGVPAAPSSNPFDMSPNRRP